MSKIKRSDIIISGAGVPGLTLAILLADFGLEVSLIEPYPPALLKDTKPSGRTVALMNTSLNVIKNTGIWDEVKSYACPLEIMRIIDDSAPGEAEIEAPFEARDIGLDQFAFNTPNDPLRAAMFEKAQKNENITIIKSALKNYTLEGAQAIVTLEDDTQISAPLLVGADGRNSPVRDIAGIDIKTRKYNQAAITCLINHSKHHQNIATEFHRTSGPLAFVPLPGNQSSIVWVETLEKAEEILKLKKSEFEALLQERSKDILGGITLETGPQSWPLMSLQSTSLTAPRVALIAETAHVMSPITAQGLNLSLRDTASLAETIADAARLGLDIGSKTVLDKYEKRRRLDIKTRVLGVDGMNRIVSQDNRPLRRLRRIGLKATYNIPPLKHFAMQHGLAPTLDQGRLASGEKL